MTDLKMDPEDLVKTTHGRYTEVISYAELGAGTDEKGVEHVVGTLVYRSSSDPFDDPVAHVEHRMAVFSGERPGFALYDTTLHSKWNDFDAYNRKMKADRPPPKPEPKIIEDAELVEDAWECDSCGHVYAEDDKGEPTYECSTCGTSGAGEDARRCESCHKFTAKTGDFSCPNCGAPEDEQTRVFAKPTDQGALATWTYPCMERDEYLESKR